LRTGKEKRPPKLAGLVKDRRDRVLRQGARLIISTTDANGTLIHVKPHPPQTAKPPALPELVALPLPPNDAGLGQAFLGVSNWSAS
jgi:hypothetical protein